MSLRLDTAAAAALLADTDRIHILTHASPDGDTLGSGFALCRALRQLGKQAQVLCPDPIPAKFQYMTVEEQTFEPAFYCSVDVASPHLLGRYEPLAEQVELAIDHHANRTDFGKRLLLTDYGAAAMLVFELLQVMHVTVDADMAACLYTGLSTDTGCFKYTNTSPLTLRMAADLIELGAPAGMINREMFDTKSRARLALEREALGSLQFAFHDRCAVMALPLSVQQAVGADEGDMDGIAPLPRQIEGVWVGITLREKERGTYKVSVRTDEHIDAAAVCSRLGGGGHARAAGCTVTASLEEATAQLLEMVAAVLPEIAL